MCNTQLHVFVFRLVGCPPFWHRKQMIMLRNIMEGKYTFSSPEWADISGTNNILYVFEDNLYLLSNQSQNYSANIFVLDAPKDLITKLLVVDPKQRITIEGALNHPFFQTVVSFSYYYYNSNSTIQAHFDYFALVGNSM